jgi:hypothetical protein
MTMQFFVRVHRTMIAAAVQRDVDRIAKRSHDARVVHFRDNQSASDMTRAAGVV